MCCELTDVSKETSNVLCCVMLYLENSNQLLNCGLSEMRNWCAAAVRVTAEFVMMQSVTVWYIGRGKVYCYIINGNVYIIIVVLTLCCIVVRVCVCWLDFMVLFILMWLYCIYGSQQNCTPYMLLVNIDVKFCIFLACGVRWIMRTNLHCYVRCTSADSLLMGWKVQLRQWR